MFRSPFRRLFQHFSRPRTPRRRALPYRPCLEALETRVVPSTIAWLRPVNGDWDNPANWVGGVVPTASDTAVIPFANITVTHATSTADAVSSLISEAAVQLSAGSLTVGDPNLVTASTSRIDKVFSVSGSATLTLDDVTLDGAGTLSNAASLNSTDTTFGVAVQNNAGTLNTNFGTNFSNPVQPFVNGPHATLLVPGNANFASGFTNQGTITLGTSGSFGGSITVFSGTLVNAPGATITFLLAGGRSNTSLLNANVTNQGTINAAGRSSLGISGGTVSNSGTLEVTSLEGLTVTGSTFTNTGAISLNGGPLTVSGGTFNQQGTLSGGNPLTLSGTTANFSGNISNAVTPLAIENSTFNTTGTLTNVGTLDITGSTINAPLVNDGTLQVSPEIENPPTAFLNGAFSNAAGATLLEGGVLTIAQGFTNHGTIDLTGASVPSTDVLTVAGGTLTNAPGATIETAASPGSSSALRAQLVNQGMLSIAEPTEFTGTLTSSGTLAVQSDLTVNLTGTAPALVNTGSVTVASLQSLGVEGGDFNNAGSVSLGSFGIVQVSGNYTQTAGTTSLGGGILTASLVNILGGVLSGPGTINANVQNSSEVDVGAAGTPGILTIVGNYAQGTSGVLKIQIGGTTAGTTFDRLNITGQATLAGTLTVKLLGGFLPSTGTRFVVITFGSSSGTFAAINGDGSHFNLQFDPQDLTLVAK